MKHRPCYIFTAFKVKLCVAIQYNVSTVDKHVLSLSRGLMPDASDDPQRSEGLKVKVAAQVFTRRPRTCVVTLRRIADRVSRLKSTVTCSCVGVSTPNFSRGTSVIMSPLDAYLIPVRQARHTNPRLGGPLGNNVLPCIRGYMVRARTGGAPHAVQIKLAGYIDYLARQQSGRGVVPYANVSKWDISRLCKKRGLCDL